MLLCFMDCGLRVAVLKEVTTSVVARMLSSKWTFASVCTAVLVQLSLVLNCSHERGGKQTFACSYCNKYFAI